MHQCTNPHTNMEVRLCSEIMQIVLPRVNKIPALWNHSFILCITCVRGIFTLTTPIFKSLQSINWFIFGFYKVRLSLHLLSKFATNLGPPKSGVGPGSGPSPHSTFTLTHTWNLSHRKWPCAASCQGRQIIHHLKKCTFFPSPIFILLPPLPSFPSLSSSLHLLFSFQIL